MKLLNKNTGEVYRYAVTNLPQIRGFGIRLVVAKRPGQNTRTYFYNSLEDLTAEWTDYKETKGEKK